MAGANATAMQSVGFDNLPLAGVGARSASHLRASALAGGLKDEKMSNKNEIKTVPAVGQKLPPSTLAAMKKPLGFDGLREEMQAKGLDQVEIPMHGKQAETAPARVGSISGLGPHNTPNCPNCGQGNVARGDIADQWYCNDCETGFTVETAPAMSERASWTPGPWSTSGKYDDAADGILVNCKADGYTYTTAIVPAFKGHPSDQQAANARLIAAAPSLAAALRKCVLELRSLPYHPTCEGGRPFEDTVNQARAALKAAGMEEA